VCVCHSGVGKTERGVAAPKQPVPKSTWLLLYLAGSAANQVMGLQGILSRPVLLALGLAEHGTRKPNHGANIFCIFFWWMVKLDRN
jgi:hypothetical protein